MADLDSRSKRASSVQIMSPWQTAPVLPDGTIALADRMHIAWTYSGIPASSAPGALTFPIAYVFDAETYGAALADKTSYGFALADQLPYQAALADRSTYGRLVMDVLGYGEDDDDEPGGP